MGEMSTPRPEYPTLAKVFKKQASAQEREKVARWLWSDHANRIEYDKLKSIWRHYGSHHEDYIPHRQDKFSVESLKSTSTRLIVYRVAASIVLLIAVSLYLFTINQTSEGRQVLVAKQGSAEYSLPDGTVVKLKAGSRLRPTPSKVDNARITKISSTGRRKGWP